MKRLKPYIYRMLSEHGNAGMGMADYEIYGEEAIIKDLKDNGFDCTIDRVIDCYTDVLSVVRGEIWFVIRVKTTRGGRTQ